MRDADPLDRNEQRARDYCATDTDYYRRAEMRWMSMEDATIEVPARWLAETGRRMADLEALVTAADGVVRYPDDLRTQAALAAAVARVKGDTT